MLGRGLLGGAIAFATFALIAAPLSMRYDRATKTWRVAKPELLWSARRSLVAVALATGAASIKLWYGLFSRDFSIAYVANSTMRGAAPWYTFSAFWSGMAGSLLLWSLVLSIYAAIFAGRRNQERERFVPFAIPVLAVAELFYLSLTFGPENPFAASPVVPFDGRGLNPLLHSPGMLIHPPMLYSGLIGSIVPFAVCVSALITRQTGADWIRVVRRWTLVPFLALGVGLVLGGAWAYTELGWGGYWGWDPVENAAFLPWLVATAFLHSAMVQERRGMLKVWNVFLVVTFASLATFGAFLTRSGLLSSVHTFAESPIGKWFFLFLGLQAVGGIALLIWRLPHLRTENALGSPVSKEATFLLNNLVFVGAAAIVLWGTILPLISEAITGQQLAVGPPFFNRVLAPIGAILLLLASVGTVTPWRRGNIGRIARRLMTPTIIACIAAAITSVIGHNASQAGLILIASFLGATSVAELVRVARTPRRIGAYVVHFGVAVMVIGFAGSIGRTQTEVTAKPGDHFSFAGYRFTYERLTHPTAPDKDINMAVLDVARGTTHVTTLHPQLNFHRNWDQPQSEIAIRTTPAADLYVILGGVTDTSNEAVFRIHNNPLVLWVWFGAAISMLGGLTSLFARPRKRKAPDAPSVDTAERVEVAG